MVHGDCSSRGCYSMTDEQMSEIYALGRDAFFGGQKSFQVQAYPFRMTAQNLARHRNNPHIAFWKMLKKGSDHFEVTHLEPKVNVCEKRYVFDAAIARTGARCRSARPRKCPAFQVPEEIASLVKDKEQKDDVEFAELSRRNIAMAPIKTGADGGMHPVFVEAVKKNQLGVAPQESILPGDHGARNHSADGAPAAHPGTGLGAARVGRGIASRHGDRRHLHIATSREVERRRPVRRLVLVEAGGRPPTRAKARSIAWRAWSASARIPSRQPPSRSRNEAGGQATDTRGVARSDQPKQADSAAPAEQAEAAPAKPADAGRSGPRKRSHRLPPLPRRASRNPPAPR